MKVPTKIKGRTMMGFYGNTFPRTDGNYFSLEGDLFISNFRAENFQELVARGTFEDGLVEVTNTLGNLIVEGVVVGHDWVINDPRIPYAWYHHEKCMARKIIDLSGGVGNPIKYPEDMHHKIRTEDGGPLWKNQANGTVRSLHFTDRSVIRLRRDESGREVIFDAVWDL